jgi:hypothetical protein
MEHEEEKKKSLMGFFLFFSCKPNKWRDSFLDEILHYGFFWVPFLLGIFCL